MLFAPNNNKSKIYNCNFGIISNTSNVLLNNLIIDECNQGFISNSQARGLTYIYMRNTQINNSINGVNIFGSVIDLDNNTFNVSNKGLVINKCYGRQIKRSNKSSVNTIARTSLEIFNSNNITLENNDFFSSQYNNFNNNHDLTVIGNLLNPLYMINERSSVFKENDISNFEVPNDFPTLAGGDGNIFECNYCAGGDYSAFSNDNSPSNDFICNLFDGGPSGLSFIGNNLGTNLEANTFTTSNIGLYLASDDAQIDDQSDKGNIFSGTFSEYGAKNENPEYTESLIINNSSAQYNPTREPFDWFTQESTETPAVCGNNCIGEPGQNFNPWVGEKYRKCLDSLFNGTKFARYSTRAKYNLLFILYRRNYLRDTSLIKYTDCIKSLLATYKTTNLHKAVEVYDKMMMPAPNSTTNVTAAIETLQDDVEYANGVATSLNNVKNEISDYLDDQIFDLDNNYYSILEDVIDTLGDLSNEEDPIAKVGIVAPIMHKYIIGDTIIQSEVDDLIEIAESCAREVGPSKYYATSLLKSLNVPYTLVDCLEEEQPRKFKTNEEENIKENNENIKISCFYDINGKLIIRNMDESTFLSSTYPTGIYIIVMQNYVGDTRVKKIFKL